MPPEVAKLLEDMRQAGQRIQRFTTGRSFPEYGADEMLRSAVERQFEILGEALSRLTKVDAVLAAQIPDYRKIIDFRNVLAHGYDAINDPIVWDAVEDQLPLLLRHVDSMLASVTGP